MPGFPGRSGDGGTADSGLAGLETSKTSCFSPSHPYYDDAGAILRDVPSKSEKT
jgi:hypothetical protein